MKTHKKAVFLLFLLFSAPFLFAQEGERRPPEGVALLARGPYEGRGLAFLSTNIIPYRAGEYRLSRGDVTVLFPSQEVLLPERWAQGPCGGRSAEPSAGGRVVAVREGERLIFFHFRGTDEAAICPFMAAFLNRFAYFSGVSTDPGRLSLPAVVEYAPQTER